MTDDELWSHLRAEAAVADVEPTAAAAIRRHAHARLAAPRPTLALVVRTTEAFAVSGAVVAQLAWAWKVVLG